MTSIVLVKANTPRVAAVKNWVETHNLGLSEPCLLITIGILHETFDSVVHLGFGPTYEDALKVLGVELWGSADIHAPEVEGFARTCGARVSDLSLVISALAIQQEKYVSPEIQFKTLRYP